MPASFGGFTYTYDQIAGCPSALHADTAPPWMLTDLATASAPAGAELTIVVGAAAVFVSGATATAWVPGMPSTAGPDALTLPVHASQEGDMTVLRAPAPADAAVMLLAVSETFERGDVTYLWRLDPAR